MAADPLVQDDVVARVLARRAQSPRRDPRQRAEPGDRAEALSRDLRGPVAAGHVRHLMEQHDVHVAIGPLGGVTGHDDPGPQPAPAGENSRMRGPQHQDASLEAEAGGDAGREPLPRRVDQRFGALADPRQACKSGQEPGEHGERAGCPHGHEEANSSLPARAVRNAGSGGRFHVRVVRRDDAAAGCSGFPAGEGQVNGWRRTHNPVRSDNLQQRERRRRKDGHRQHPVTDGGRSPTQRTGRADACQQEDRAL